MTIRGSYTFSASAEEVWNLLLDPQVLIQVVPGLQSFDTGPENEITAVAVVGFGPFNGTVRARFKFLEEEKPAHARLQGEAQGGPGRAQGVCVIDAQEQNGATFVKYSADVTVNGVPAVVSDRFLGMAANSVMKRVTQRLQPAGTVDTGASNLDRAARTWDEIDIDRVRQVAWSSIEYVSESFKRKFSGALPLNQYVQTLLANRLPNHQRTDLHGAALVCGDMMAERVFFEDNQIVRFSDVDGFDISSVSLAKYQPSDLQFNAHVMDCNNIMLEREKYDLIVACHGAHHVYNLGNLFYQANKGLKPHGLFYMIEWIGPEYLQIPRANHLLSSVLLLSLFNHATRTTHMGNIKGLHVQAPPEAFEPSEACNSTELLPQFRKYFDPISIVLHGGLAYPIYEGIAQNIDQSKSSNRVKIRFVHVIEQLFTSLRIVKPLFAIAVAEKRQHVF